MRDPLNRLVHGLGALAPLLLALWGAGTAEAATSRKASQRTIEGFEITREPTPPDWRYFIKAPEAGREKLWAYHAKKGKKLGDWAWGWRLGWVRTCSASPRPYCSRILAQALFDKALVVRAEAATRLGRRLEGSQDPKAVGLFAKAFKDRRNQRNGRPLYVQNRILYALRQVGGGAALETGRDLAATHPESRAYWAKLQAGGDAGG